MLLPAPLRSGLLTLLLLMLGNPLLAQVEYGQQEYLECVENCNAKFESVLEDEADCSKTIQYIHSDLTLLKNLIADASVCKGPHSAACNDFREYALAGLERLLAYTLENENCLTLDAKAIQDELWMFDLAKACKGDGTFTDFHDFFGAKRGLVETLNLSNPHYQFTKRSLDPYDDMRGHRPECDPGARPARSYTWPLFEFYVALDSLIPYQACMPSCREPTQRELRLWALEKELAGTRAQVETFATTLRRESAAREQRLVDEYGTSFPCSAMSEQLLAVKAHKEALTRFDAAIRTMLEDPEKPAHRLDNLEKESGQLAAAVADGVLETTLAECAQEDERARTLVKRRRAVVDTVLRGDTFCIDAARAFASDGERGASCTWLGDCDMPLLCKNGTCQGSVSVLEVKGVLDGATALADRGLQLKLHTDKGLDLNVQRKIYDLEQDLARFEEELTKAGWQTAVAAWRQAYAKELPGRIKTLAAELDEAIAAHAPEEGSSRPPRACRRALKDLEAARESLTRVTDALGECDPVSRANWVRLKARDLRDVRTQYEGALETLEGTCGEAESSFPVVPVAVGAGIVLLLVAAGLFLFLRRRRSGRSGAGEL